MVKCIHLPIYAATHELAVLLTSHFSLQHNPRVVALVWYSLLTAYRSFNDLCQPSNVSVILYHPFVIIWSLKAIHCDIIHAIMFYPCLHWLAGVTWKEINQCLYWSFTAQSTHWVMSSAAGLPNHTFTAQAYSSKWLISIVHILSLGKAVVWFLT